MAMIEAFKEAICLLGLLDDLGVFSEHVDAYYDRSKYYPVGKEAGLLFENEAH